MFPYFFLTVDEISLLVIQWLHPEALESKPLTLIKVFS
jgi:hypothetical protein